MVEMKPDDSTNSVDDVLEISRDKRHKEEATQLSNNEVFCGFTTPH